MKGGLVYGGEAARPSAAPPASSKQTFTILRAGIVIANDIIVTVDLQEEASSGA